MFLCDPSAGVGRPIFLNESNPTYSFKWYTAYACVEPAIECIAADDGTRYDLSR